MNKNKINFFNNKNVFFYIFISVIIIILLINIFFTFFTKFEKQIIIKNKYIRNLSKGKGSYFVVDNNNNAYILSDNLLLFQFNKTDDYNLITIGQKYKIYGYGYRVNLLSMYPKIYDLKKI
jgi:cell division protein YceG involved in septum cleavage